MKKTLIVVDMQNDFIDMALGTKEAVEIVPFVKQKIREYHENGHEIIYTRDTHSEDYLETPEGKKLPVKHCIRDTWGWEICDELLPYADVVIDKETFGSVDLPAILRDYGDEVESIELCGLCTDICVISNAVILKANFTEAKMTVDSNACAGVTEASHKNALEAMKMVQIDII